MAIEFYKEFGDLGYLANYADYGFWKNGIFYKTVEHYYQSEKYDNLEIKNKIIKASTPKEASNIGRDRNNKRIDNFKAIKDKVMYEGILEKFRQNRKIAYKLVETRNEAIAEATIDEYYWGIGKDKSGLNKCGKILCQVRDDIKKEILNSIIDKARKEDKVYVIGHKSPDADSILSSCLLSRILRSIGINAVAAVLDKDYEYCNSDKKIIMDYLPDGLEVVNPNDKKFILVDHNNLEGLDSKQVLGSIDHHIISGEVYDTLEIEYSSTGLLIYDLFRDIYDFSLEEKRLIYITVLTDTEYLCSKSRYRKDDQELVESLGIDLDVKEMQRKYFVTNDFNLSIKDNLYSNYKEYDRDGRHIVRSLIYSYTDDYLKYYKAYVGELSNDWLLIWCDFENLKTYVYFNGQELEYDYPITSTNVILKKVLK